MSALVLKVERSTRKLTVFNAEILLSGETEVPVELYYFEESEAYQLDDGEPITFEIKQRGEYSATALASCSIWTRGASEEDPYEGTIDLTDTDIATLMGDEDSLEVMGGVQWEEGGAVRASRPANFYITNVVVTPAGDTTDLMFSPSGDPMFTPSDSLMFA